jgi:hypothetical protein
MNKPNAKDDLPQDHAHATDDTPDRLLAFLAKLLGALKNIDPRVINQQERRDGRASFGL